MAGSADTVKIRVRPDVTGFETELRKTTDKKRQTIVEARLNAERLEAELAKIQADKKYIDIEARTEYARMKVETLKKFLATLGDKKIRIEGDIDQAKAQIVALNTELKSATGDRKIKIAADITEANKRLADLERDLGENKKFTAQVTADTRQARRELRELEGDLAVKVKVEADTRKAKDQIEDLEQEIELKADLDAAHAREQMAVLARNRYVTLIARLRSSEAARQLKQLVQGLSGFTMIQNWQRALTGLLANLPQTILKLTALLPVFAGLASAAMSALSVVTPMAYSLSAIAPGALLAVPALGALAASIGVLVAAFRDLDADDASAATRAFSTTLEQVKDQLHDLRLGIQDAFFVDGSFTASFERLIDTLLPSVREGLVGISTQMSTLGAGLMDTFTNNLSSGALTSFFANVQEGILTSTSGINGFIEGLTRLGTEGSAVLPDVGVWITRIGEHFNQWTIDADIVAMLREAGVQAGHLHDVLSNLWGIIRGVFGAMDTGRSTGLESLAATLGRIRDIVVSSAFYHTVNTIFEGAAKGSAAFKEGLGDVGRALEKLAPLISQVLETGGEMLHGLLSGLSEALSSPVAQDGIAAALEALSTVAASIPWDAIGASLGSFGQTMATLSPLVTSLLTTLLPLLAPILDVIQELIAALLPVVEILLPPLVDLIESLLPIISALLVPMAEWWKVLAELLAPALEWLTQIINDYVVPAIEWIADIMSDVVDVIKAIIAGDWDAAWASAQEIVDKCVQKLAELWEWIKEKASEIWGELKDAVIGYFTDLWTKAQEIWQAAHDWLIGLVQGLVDSIVGFFTDLWTDAQQIWQDGVDWLVETVQGLVDSVVGFFTDLWHNVIDPIVKMWTDAVDWFLYGDWTITGLVGGLIKKITDFFEALPGKILQLVTGMWESVKSTTMSAAEAVTGFVAGLVENVINFFKSLPGNIARFVTEMWENVKSITLAAIGAVTGFVSNLVTNVVTFFSDLKIRIATKVSEIWDSAVQGFQTGITAVITWVQGLPGRVVSALGNLGSLLYSAGHNIIQGFLNGIVAAFRAVKDFIGGIADWIFAHKGPLEYDYKLLQPAGNKIMGGFHDSLEAGMKDVQSLVSGFAPDLASTIDVNQTLNTATGEQPGGRVEALLAGILGELKTTPEVSERQLGKAIARLAYPELQRRQGDDYNVMTKGGVPR